MPTVFFSIVFLLLSSCRIIFWSYLPVLLYGKFDSAWAASKSKAPINFSSNFFRGRTGFFKNLEKNSKIFQFNRKLSNFRNDN